MFTGNINQLFNKYKSTENLFLILSFGKLFFWINSFKFKLNRLTQYNQNLHPLNHYVEPQLLPIVVELWKLKKKFKWNRNQKIKNCTLASTTELNHYSIKKTAKDLFLFNFFEMTTSFTPFNSMFFIYLNIYK